MVPSLSSSALALLLTSPLAFSQSVERTTAFGNGADTYGNQASVTAVNGATSTIQAKEASSNDRLAYLRFDISGLSTVNPDATSALSISNASLSLTTASDATTTSFNFILWGLVDGTDADRLPTDSLATGGWLETGADGLTYTNAPARNGNVALSTSSAAQTGTPASYAVQIGTFSLSGLATGTTFTLGSTASNVSVQSATFAANLLSFLRQDTNGVASLVLTRTSDNSAISSFYAKENLAGTGGVNNPAFNPTLRFNVIPEPASLGLLSLAAVSGLGTRRFRRTF